MEGRVTSGLGAGGRLQPPVPRQVRAMWVKLIGLDIGYIYSACVLLRYNNFNDYLRFLTVCALRVIRQAYN